MDLLEQNIIGCLPFSSPHISSSFIKDVNNYSIKNRTIVINPNPTVVYVDRLPRSIISPFSSTILQDVSIKQADSLILFEVVDTDNIADIIFESGWNLLGDIIGNPVINKDSKELPYPSKTPLWKSAQSTIGEIELDPYAITDLTVVPQQLQKFSIKVNLWFAPAQTNCFIHNKHDFIEIHSQIFGRGRMQKFTAQDPHTLYEDIFMCPGYTTSLPFCSVEEADQFIYPWHQYYADTDCIWLAIEYHPCRD